MHIQINVRKMYSAVNGYMLLFEVIGRRLIIFVPQTISSAVSEYKLSGEKQTEVSSIFKMSFSKLETQCNELLNFTFEFILQNLAQVQFIESIYISQFSFMKINMRNENLNMKFTEYFKI